MTQTTTHTILAAIERLEAAYEVALDHDGYSSEPMARVGRAAVPALCQALRLALSAIVYALDVMDADSSIKDAHHIRGLVHAIAAELEAERG